MAPLIFGRDLDNAVSNGNTVRAETGLPERRVDPTISKQARRRLRAINMLSCVLIKTFYRCTFRHVRMCIGDGF